MCAKDFTRTSCFVNGDSGGPLMVKEVERYQIEGLLSFNKGCEVLNIHGQFDSDDDTWSIDYRSENPTAFTKLSCFMPWIAEQYDMEYEAGEEAVECRVGNGGTTENNQNCRANAIIEATDEDDQTECIQEPNCIFPFYFENKIYNECILLVVEGYTFQTFRCPVLEITTKHGENATSAFTFETALDPLCPVDSTDLASPLDPDFKVCEKSERRRAFANCKNDCPGVRGFGLVAGGAPVLAASGIAAQAITQYAPWGLGLFGLFLPMISPPPPLPREACSDSRSCIVGNQCCKIVFGGPNVGWICPQAC